MNPDESEKSNNGFLPFSSHASHEPFFRSQSNFTFQSSNSSSIASNSLYSSTKRQREDDYSSDGTLSSTLSLQASSENSAYHTQQYQPPYYNSCKNESNCETYPTSSFKRMKLEHNTNGAINQAPILEYHTQNQTLMENQCLNPPNNEDKTNNFGYNNYVGPEPYSSNVPSTIIQEKIIQRGAELPNVASANFPNSDSSPNYSSVNRLLGSLHRNRRNRQIPNVPTPQNTTTAHKLTNVGLYENMNIAIQPRRRQNKRTLLHTTSSLY